MARGDAVLNLISRAPLSFATLEVPAVWDVQQCLLRGFMTHLTAWVYWQLGLMVAVGNWCMSHPEGVN